jgi:hypothetical protein
MAGDHLSRFITGYNNKTIAKNLSCSVKKRLKHFNALWCPLFKTVNISTEVIGTLLGCQVIDFLSGQSPFYQQSSVMVLQKGRI